MDAGNGRYQIYSYFEHIERTASQVSVIRPLEFSVGEDDQEALHDKTKFHSTTFRKFPAILVLNGGAGSVAFCCRRSEW